MILCNRILFLAFPAAMIRATELVPSISDLMGINTTKSFFNPNHKQAQMGNKLNDQEQMSNNQCKPLGAWAEYATTDKYKTQKLLHEIFKLMNLNQLKRFIRELNAKTPRTRHIRMSGSKEKIQDVLSDTIKKWCNRGSSHLVELAMEAMDEVRYPASH
ncbi:hypothetical protein C8J57DRAFT_1254826 [Mycena rebaudengoi]|nr:hypothetical protein C8J57DRAFT_1254826 [Mycena rebaudengoi]